MSEEQVNHSANIIQMVSQRDEKIAELTTNYKQALGDKKDVEAELMSQSRENVSLRIKLRRNDREHEAAQEVLSERIREITGFCNEQTEEIRQLKARPVGDAYMFVRHLLLSESVNIVHNAVATLGHAFANKATNKTATEIGELMQRRSTLRITSLGKIVNRICSYEDKVAKDLGLSKDITEFVSANIDLFCKDEAYKTSNEILRSLAAVSKHNNWQNAAVRTVRQYYRDFPLIVCVDRQILEDEDDYEELFGETVAKVFLLLIKENNLQ